MRLLFKAVLPTEIHSKPMGWRRWNPNYCCAASARDAPGNALKLWRAESGTRWVVLDRRLRDFVCRWGVVHLFPLASRKAINAHPG